MREMVKALSESSIDTVRSWTGLVWIVKSAYAPQFRLWISRGSKKTA